MLTAPNMMHWNRIVNAKVIVYNAPGIESGFPGMAAKKGKDWQAVVKGLLKAELARRNLSYADLAVRLAAIGVKDNELNLKNKVGRGSFTAVFFVQCLESIGCRTIHLEDE